ncbi:MAG: hypothetical protein AB2814_00300 [Candidatus Sedimenticola endophacoides]
MAQKKRGDQPPVPQRPEQYFNSAQLRTLHQMENFGWELKFIRRPLFQEPVAVMVDPSGKICGVLEESGELNRDSDIVIRD